MIPLGSGSGGGGRAWRAGDGRATWKREGPRMLAVWIADEVWGLSQLIPQEIAPAAE